MKRQGKYDWETVYAEMPVEEMHWYYPTLDPDLEKTLKDYNIKSGTFLDLGTGPGTQAIELAKRGFTVTGTDISKDAVKRASKLSDKVQFIQDDILNSKVNRQFDYVFDRGCFHVMSEENRPKYLETVSRLLKTDGLLFIKCFSDKEPDIGRGPYRFSKEMMGRIFADHFDIESIRDTEYQGTRKPTPKALFVILKLRRENKKI
ncbi:MAG TPA: methyltransferase domain-containing protein [Candidatus Acidoferrales bacterium]|nr:methyltransferase domain-containing protein [Candidatus Acidoferrales bacterium]